MYSISTAGFCASVFLLSDLVRCIQDRFIWSIISHSVFNESARKYLLVQRVLAKFLRPVTLFFTGLSRRTQIHERGVSMDGERDFCYYRVYWSNPESFDFTYHELRLRHDIHTSKLAWGEFWYAEYSGAPWPGGIGTTELYWFGNMKALKLPSVERKRTIIVVK